MYVFLFFFANLVSAQTKPNIWLDELIKINQNREQRAQSLLNTNPIMPEHFQAVCQPVLQEIKTLAKKYNINIKPVTAKPRNLKHQAEKKDLYALEQLRQQGQNKPLFIDQTQKIYYSAIYTTAACLKCHGDTSKIPDFIKNKYPNDLAFGYKTNELRGAYKIQSK